MQGEPPELNTDGEDPTYPGLPREYLDTDGEHETRVDPLSHFLDPGRELPPDLEREHRSVLLRPGDVLLDRFEVVDMLGFGGMGAVYRVKDKALGTDCALKVMLPSLIGSDKAKERFYSEVRISQQLAHDGIVRVHTMLKDPARGIEFFVMEFVEGKTLHRLLREQGGKLAVVDALDITLQLCDALEYAHRYTVHRDLKPQNIMVKPDGRVKILDFGLAKLMSPGRMTKSSMALGTAYYQAPEQSVRLQELDQRADIYSLGVILYQLLTAKIPLGRVREPSALVPELPKALDAIVLRCLESEPADRFANVSELREALRNVFTPPKAAKRAKWPFAVVGLAAVACILAAVFGAQYLVGGLPGNTRESGPSGVAQPPAGAGTTTAPGNVAHAPSRAEDNATPTPSAHPPAGPDAAAANPPRRGALQARTAAHLAGAEEYAAALFSQAEETLKTAETHETLKDLDQTLAHYARATEQFQIAAATAVAHTTSEPQVLAETALKLANLGALEGAEYCLERIDRTRVRDTTMYKLLIILGRGLLNIDPQRGLALLEEAHSGFPEARTPEDEKALLEGYLAEKRPEDAQRTLMNISAWAHKESTRIPCLIDAAIALGDYAFENGDYCTAAEAYAMVTDAPEQADRAVKKGTKTDPMWAKYQLGNALLELAKYPESQALLQEVAQSDTPWAQEAKLKTEYVQLRRRLRDHADVVSQEVPTEQERLSSVPAATVKHVAVSESEEGGKRGIRVTADVLLERLEGERVEVAAYLLTDQGQPVPAREGKYRSSMNGGAYASAEPAVDAEPKELKGFSLFLPVEALAIEHGGRYGLAAEMTVWNYSGRGEKKLAVGARAAFTYVDAGPPKAAVEAKNRIGDDERKYAVEEVGKGDAAWSQAERAGSYDAAQPLWETARTWYAKAVEMTPERKQAAAVPPPAPVAASPSGGGARAGEVRTFEGIEMVWCPPGTFAMGGEQSAKDTARKYGLSENNYTNEHPQHQVTLTEGFWLGKYEVTQEQWEHVMGSNPSKYKGSKNPVENVSWNDAQAFCKKLGNGFRLPTEAEWEYACRAGSTTNFCFGDSESGLGQYAWYKDNSGLKDASEFTVHPVGGKKPNAWGLYDMHGNVDELCQDWEGDYASGSVIDPLGPTSGYRRVTRGGCWCFFSYDARCARRSRMEQDGRCEVVGFRLCRSASATAGKAEGTGTSASHAPSDGGGEVGDKAQAQDSTSQKTPVSSVERRVVIVNGVLFAQDQASVLTGEAKAEVDKLIAEMQKHPRDTLLIEGHASSTEQDPVELGKKRAIHGTKRNCRRTNYYPELRCLTTCCPQRYSCHS